jgi:hypothetical protein
MPKSYERYLLEKDPLRALEDATVENLVPGSKDPQTFHASNLKDNSIEDSQTNSQISRLPNSTENPYTRRE